MMPDMLDTDPTCGVCTRITAALRRLQANLPEHPNVEAVEHLIAAHGPHGEHGAGCSIVCGYGKLWHMAPEAAAALLFLPADAQRIVEQIATETGLPHTQHRAIGNPARMRLVITCAWSSVEPCAPLAPLPPLAPVQPLEPLRPLAPLEGLR